MGRLPKFDDLISCGSKDIYLKMHPVSWADTHHDVTDLLNHRMVKMQKVKHRENGTEFFNKKVFNLCLRWHILRSYWFVAEVTFEYNQGASDLYRPVVLSSSWQLFKLLLASASKFLILSEYFNVCLDHVMLHDLSNKFIILSWFCVCHCVE